MKLKHFILLLTGNLWLIATYQQVNACGYYESEEEYRAMMFRASLPGMEYLHPFLYTHHVYNSNNTDRNESDRFRNCLEWQQTCTPDISMDDIYMIQYETDPQLFITCSEKNSWQITFTENTFIEFLTHPENKELLDYMLFAKKAEFTEVGTSSRFEEWDVSSYYMYNSAYPDHIGHEDVMMMKYDLWKEARELLPTLASNFLQQRYAFQVCRLSTQLRIPEITAETYKKYFNETDTESLMNVWAGFFYGLCSEDEGYRFLIRTFEHSNEKKFRCVQLFNEKYRSEYLTDHEKSIGIVMTTLRNPGKALSEIEAAYQLDATNAYIPFLILREINKLEDWLMTPTFYKQYSYYGGNPFYDPDIIDDYFFYTRLNLVADNQYMEQLKRFIAGILPSADIEKKDYYRICLAHLSLLQEKPSDARKYLASITTQANPTIQLQKKLEAIWLAIKTINPNSEQLKKIFIENIADLERVTFPDFDNRHMLYTLTLSLAHEYLKKGNRVYGNLLRMKADMYRNDWPGSQRYYHDYSGMRYFDNNATVADMDQLLVLLEKKQKTDFEVYLLGQPLTTIDAYKDLKGTIAFRNDDLQTAYDTFRSMPQDYWNTKKSRYVSYLNEDPFIPKILVLQDNRTFDYSFNKTDFVEELLRLKDEGKKGNGTAYIRLANALFNTSYWGSAWLMSCYMWSINDPGCLGKTSTPEWLQNYLLATRAEEYYRKGLKLTHNDEEKAYANMMLYAIQRLTHTVDGNKKHLQAARRYGNLFLQYPHTETFKKYMDECPGISEFLGYKHP